MPSIAFVVSPHGFGHAARACALMEGLWRLRPELRFEIVTTVPRWFFAQSLEASFRVHRLVTDVGLVQRDPLTEDLAATRRRVGRLLDPGSGALDRLCDRLRRLDCGVVVCDIAPLGITAANRLGLPSVLVENFTWDWIYEGYEDSCPELRPHARAMRRMCSAAQLHIQTLPVCVPMPDAVQVPPMSRQPRTPPSAVRRRLGVPEDEAMVLLTMGGLGWEYRSIEGLADHGRVCFVVPGGGSSARRTGRLHLLPFRSDFLHPDLVNASQVVVGKLGYSTVAEVYHARAAMLFIGRPGFRESATLEGFVRSTTASAAISREAFGDGSWLEDLDRLLGAPAPPEERPNGAAEAAAAILDSFGKDI